MAALEVVALVPSPSGTLYQIQEEITALMDTADLVSPEQENEFLTVLTSWLVARGDKTDAVGRWLAHIESQITFADCEIDRLRERKLNFERVLDRTKDYIVRVIQNIGLDGKGRWSKLDGKTVSFGVRKRPVSVEILDATLVPVEYRTTTLKMPAALWDELLDTLQLEMYNKVLEVVKRSDDVSKTLVKQAIEDKVEVPGSKLVSDRLSLVRT